MNKKGGKMKMNKSKFISRALLLAVLSIGLLIGAYAEGGKGSGKNLNKTTATGEFFNFNINNLRIPLDNKGVIADVNPGDGIGAGGTFDGHVFLFSSGFYVSGYHDLNNDGIYTENELWGNGVLSASRIEDYQPGPFGSSQGDPRNQVYVVQATDQAFGESWQEWSDAVDLGADFYDGDGDGVYTPEDKNGNGTWDPDEDRPDLIGDITAWTVFNDGVPTALRRYTVSPKGLEIRQTVFGFNSKTAVGNMMFVRYRLVNTGAVADEFYNVYFSAAADPDLGDYESDLVGSDTTLSAGYVYNDGPDAEFGSNPPCFLMDFFQGPYTYIPDVTFEDANGNGVYDAGEVALDTAYQVNGKVLGIKEIVGARTLPLTSMTQYMQSHPTHGDPDTHFELRNYMIGGKGKNGDSLYISNWAFGNGSTLGADTSRIKAKYMYSGDPGTGRGWLNIVPIDQRQMSNTGPFTLRKGEPQDITVAYIVGRGNSATNSVTIAKNYSDIAQKVFNNNFPSPPPPPPVAPAIVQGEGFFDIRFNTSEQTNYNAVDTVLGINRKVQGFYITAFKYNTSNPTVNGEVNEQEIHSYRIDNFINDIYQVSPNGGRDLVRKASETSLDPIVYGDPTQGRLKLRIKADPFSGDPLVKGQEYYFKVGVYTLNLANLVPMTSTLSYGATDDYYDPVGGAYEEFETGMLTVTYGTEIFSPALGSNPTGSQKAGGSSGEVKFIPISKNDLNGNTYAIEFFRDSSKVFWETYWKLSNTSTNTVLLDSMKNYSYEDDDIAGTITDGFLAKVAPVAPIINSFTDQQAKYDGTVWFPDFLRASNTGVYYLGKDIPKDKYPEVQSTLFTTASDRSDAISADRLRRVELRFGTGSKAYRYLNGYVGNAITRKNNYSWAGQLTAADTAGIGKVGKLGEGFVDVPFSAWVVDERFGEEYQLATGFVEADPKSGGNPDGNWDPGVSLLTSKEFIVIFDAPYDATGAQKVYTGGDFTVNGATTTVYADLVKGYTIPAGADGVTAKDIKTAKSKFFNTLYMVQLARKDASSFYQDGDVLNIELTEYPYTPLDRFEFTTPAGGGFTEDDARALFEKVNVFPNPLFAFNPQTSVNPTAPADDPFVTFSNLPEEVTVKIFTVSGTLIRTLGTADKSSPTSPFLRWDLQNEDGLRVASGMYLAIVDSPKYGQKILKFAVIMPQKQLQRY